MRAARRAHILLNAVVITINRTAKVRHGGGFRQETSTAGPFTVSVFKRNEGRVAPDESVQGTLHRQPWGLLADWQADIQAGTEGTDVFDVPGLGRFRVVHVKPDLLGADVWGYQAQLEREC